MDALERAQAIGQLTATDQKGASLYKVRRELDRHFTDTTGYEGGALVNGAPLELLVSAFRQYVEIKEIRARPGADFTVGDVVEVYGSVWLVTEKDPNTQVCAKGKIELCNREIRWQDRKTGEIHSRWCIVKKPYFRNITDLYLLETSTREYKVIVPYDEATRLVDLGQRFLFEAVSSPKSYRITAVDANTLRHSRNGTVAGCIVWNIEQDQFNPAADSAEQMLADTREPAGDGGDTAPLPFSHEGRCEAAIGSPVAKVFNALEAGRIAVLLDEADAACIDYHIEERAVHLRFMRGILPGSGCWLCLYRGGRLYKKQWVKAVGLI